MDRESIEKLRFDKRLARRPRWVSEDDVSRELESLPDVGDKILPPDAQDSPAAPEEEREEPRAAAPELEAPGDRPLAPPAPEPPASTETES